MFCCEKKEKQFKFKLYCNRIPLTIHCASYNIPCLTTAFPKSHWEVCSHPQYRTDIITDPDLSNLSNTLKSSVKFVADRRNVRSVTFQINDHVALSENIKHLCTLRAKPRHEYVNNLFNNHCYEEQLVDSTCIHSMSP